MGLSIREVLDNANYNLIENKGLEIAEFIGRQQLENYTLAKELGANDEDDWYDWEDKVEEYKNKK